MNKMAFFENCRKVETIKTFLITIFLLFEHCSVHLFRAAFYKFIFLLHKDALFHGTLAINSSDYKLPLKQKILISQKLLGKIHKNSCYKLGCTKRCSQAQLQLEQKILISQHS